MAGDHRRWFSSKPESKLFVFCSLLSLVSATCAPQPIPIRIGNVTLSTDEVARGLDISVGSPQQAFAFLPQWPLNNTFVYGTSGFCGTSWTSTGCTTFRGGSYDELNSTTRGVATTSAFPADASPYPAYDYVTDNFTLSSNVTLGNFPIGIAQADWGEQGYFPQMALGLGPNSTILTVLKSTGQIASRSWSMFWGRTGATTATQLDGSFVFGGYDRAKVTGANYTSSLSNAKSSCSTNILVTITDMILNFPNGTDASLFGAAESSTVLAACIVPSYPVLMTIPTDPYFNAFETLTSETVVGRSFGLYYYGMLYGTSTDSSPSIPYAGDLTIKFDSGLSVRITNDQLVVPNLSIDETSGALIANSSTPELVLNAIQSVNAEDLPQLGRQFLTAAYLMVNQDANEFTLWEANPTSNVDLVAVDTNNAVVDTACAAASGAASTTTSSAPGSTTTASTSSKISSGAIAGAAVGGIAVVGALVGFLIWFLVRRRRGGEGSTRSHSELPCEAKSELPGEAKSELPGEVQSELPGEANDMRHEADGSQIPYFQQHLAPHFEHMEPQELPS